MPKAVKLATTVTSRQSSMITLGCMETPSDVSGVTDTRQWCVPPSIMTAVPDRSHG